LEKKLDYVENMIVKDHTYIKRTYMTRIYNYEG